MRWVEIRYDYETKIRRQVCHPYAARRRIADIKRRYSVAPHTVKPLEDLHVDFGGAIREGDPRIVVELGPGRRLAVFAHHAAMLEHALRKALLASRSRDWGFVRIRAWPSTVVMLSRRDARRLLREIRPDWAAIAKRDEEILDVFANASSRTPEEARRTKVALVRAQYREMTKRKARADLVH